MSGQLFDHAHTRLRVLIRLLRVIRSLKGERDLDFKGDFYTIAAQGMLLPRPIRPQVPIYVAGVGAAMLRLTGEVADGLAGHPCCSVRYLKEMVLPCLADGFRKSGRR